MPEEQRAADPARRGPDRVEERDRERPRLHREDLARGQVRRARARRGEEEGDEDQPFQSPGGAERLAREEERHDRADRGRGEVGAGDHRLATDRVEQAPERDRPEEVADGEDDQEHRHEARRDPVEAAVEGAEVEGDAVVDESLADEQRDREQRSLRVLLHGDGGDLPERDGLALANLDRLVGLGQLIARLLGNVLLDPLDDALRFVLPAVDEQPARTLGHVPPDDQDRQAEHDAEAERDTPAHVLRQEAGVEQENRRRRAERGADPVGAVDDQVDATANARGDQLVDRGVDRGILAADPGAGEEPSGVEVPGAEGARGRGGGEDVDGERDQEQLLASEAVGQLAEDERPDAGAGDVDRRRRPDLAGRQLDPAALLGQTGGDRPDDRHLETVEDPDGAQPDHDEPVEARPRQPVEAGRDPGLDRAGLDAHSGVLYPHTHVDESSGWAATVGPCSAAPCSGTAFAFVPTET